MLAGVSAILQCVTSWTNADGIMYLIATNTRGTLYKHL